MFRYLTQMKNRVLDEENILWEKSSIVKPNMSSGTSYKSDQLWLLLTFKKTILATSATKAHYSVFLLSHLTHLNLVLTRIFPHFLGLSVKRGQVLSLSRHAQFKNVKSYISERIYTLSRSRLKTNPVGGKSSFVKSCKQTWAVKY